MTKRYTHIVKYDNSIQSEKYITRYRKRHEECSKVLINKYL